VFDADTAEERGKAGESVILVRWETTPDDFHGMVQAAGILTAHGGLTSHAAVVARGMGTPCVTGCEALHVDLRAKTARLPGHELQEGDTITINGGTGQDDLVGGTGRTDSATPSSATDGRIDVGDVIQGEADFDAISGDNSRIVRQTQDGDAGDNPDDTGLWKANTFNNAVDRVIALLDI
ncbi:hypothetical protein GWI34_39175, partial [Actinomadura sp. DSM 109109]|nr:hypothetical protein [Actinomadura lepetitiana]